MSALKPIGEMLDDSIEAPDARLVLCDWCRKLTIPGGKWDCGHCGRCCKFGVVAQLCDHCDEPTFVVRRGYRMSRQACRCQDSPEQRESYRRGMSQREQRDREEADRELAARANRNVRRTLTRAASDCLREKVRLQGGCSYRQESAPHECCKYCPKFREGPRNNNRPVPAMAPLTPPPMMDLED